MSDVRAPLWVQSQRYQFLFELDCMENSPIMADAVHRASRANALIFAQQCRILDRISK